MNALKTLLPAAVVAAAVAASASANAAVFIGVSTDGGAHVTQVATGPSSAGVVGQAFGNFVLNNISGTQSGIRPDLLQSNSINTTSKAGGGTLDVYISATDLDSATSAFGFISSMTLNALTFAGSVTGSTFANADNSVFGENTALASHFFGATGTSVTANAGPFSFTSPYSITEQYHIVATTAGSANSTIDVSSVPEPATWGLMILGFGGIGAMVRSRRRQAVFA